MRCLVPIFFAVLACAGTDPKPKASDYEVYQRVGSVELGAEYTVHSFSEGSQAFMVDGYLAVEVALFPGKSESVMVSSAEFTLRIDGRRSTLSAAPAQMVVSSMERRQWQQPSGVQAAGGVGDKVVILGGPSRQTPPYGGQPRSTPRIPRAPEPENPSGLPPADKVNAAELLVQTALPEGTYAGPVSGYLYFPFTGKASKIKSVELLYRGATLKLK